MASKYQMQARSSANGQLYSWLADAPDFGAIGYAGPGAALDAALSGGGLASPGTLPVSNQVTIGGVGVTIGGVPVTITVAAPQPVTIGGVPVTIGGVPVTIT